MPDIETFGSGDFEHRVALRRKLPDARGPGGQAKPAYSQLGIYWASVRPLSGREAMNARMLKSELGYRIVMRNAGTPIYQNDQLYRAVTAETFNVEYVERVAGRNFYWSLLCTVQATPYAPPAA